MSSQAKQVVTPFRMTPRVAEAKIHELAKNSSNVIWGGHCVERSEQRDITLQDALSILRTGIVVDCPEAGKLPGEWKAKIVKNIRGNRDAGVVTIIMTKQGMLKIKTVEWEDLP
ncbi:MAG: DUF4258 domain-containing protein [Bdellovibrionales bacterium]